MVLYEDVIFLGTGIKEVSHLFCVGVLVCWCVGVLVGLLAYYANNIVS